MKKPISWPADLRLSRISKAGHMGEPAEWGVFRDKEQVASVYYSSRGWAYAGQGRYAEAIGRRGVGYDGMRTMLEALHAFQDRWMNLESAGTL